MSQVTTKYADSQRRTFHNKSTYHLLILFKAPLQSQLSQSPVQMASALQQFLMLIDTHLFTPPSYSPLEKPLQSKRMAGAPCPRPNFELPGYGDCKWRDKV